MNNDLLSNTEIDALLDMFKAEEAHMETASAQDFSLVAGADGGAREPIVSKLDLFKPNRLTRDQMSTIERCGDTAARAIGATTSDKLRLSVACDCVGVEQQRFGGWLSSLAGGPVAIYILRIPPLEHPVLLSMSTGMLYAAVDRILGGSGKISDVPSELTAAEYTVADAFVGPCLDHICRAFEALGETSWDIESRHSNPSSAQILGAHEVAVSIYFQITGEFLLGDMRLVMPYATLEPHLDKLAQSRVGAFNRTPGSARDSVVTSMNEVGVDMCVELGSAKLSLRDLLALQVGDVVSLDTRLGDPLVAPVQGVPKFLGAVGTRGSRLAYCVQSRIN